MEELDDSYSLSVFGENDHSRCLTGALDPFGVSIPARRAPGANPQPDQPQYINVIGVV